MKHNLHFLLFGAALSLFVASCKPEITGELGEPSDKVAGLNGTWELNQFVQKDPNNPIQEERDLSPFYIQEGTTPLRLTLNNSDLTYSVEYTVGRNFFGDAGTWKLDNNEAPSSITLYGADTLELELLGIVLPTSNNFAFQFKRACSDGFTNVFYKFNFTRVQ